MSREAHIWGESDAADQVRSLVVGLAPSEAGKRLMAVFQAYIDDSVGEGGEFVLGGHIASADAWEAFSREWEQMLPYGLRDEHGFYFKMSEMALLPERMERVAAFYRIIENHALMSISIRFNLRDFHRAQRRILIPGFRFFWNEWGNPHFFAFRMILDGFHTLKEQWADTIPVDQPVDFIFDDHATKKWLLQAWGKYIESRPADRRHLYGATPIFRDDRKFLPLQAADLWAWWVREWAEQGGDFGERLRDPKFGKWDEHEKRRLTNFEANEDQLADTFLNVAADSTPIDWWAFDIHPVSGKLLGKRGRNSTPDIRWIPRGRSPYA